MRKLQKKRLSGFQRIIPIWCFRWLKTDGSIRLTWAKKLLHESDLKKLDWQIHPASDASVSPRGWEVCSGSGNEDFFEPALGVTHADGNASTWLYYVSSSTKAVEGGTQTDIHLRDDKYPVNVTLHYVAYEKEDVIKTWSEISHQEKKACTVIPLRFYNVVFQSSRLLFD